MRRLRRTADWLTVSVGMEGSAGGALSMTLVSDLSRCPSDAAQSFLYEAAVMIVHPVPKEAIRDREN